MSGHAQTTVPPLANRPTALPRQRTADVGWALNIAFHVSSRRKDSARRIQWQEKCFFLAIVEPPPILPEAQSAAGKVVQVEYRTKELFFFVLSRRLSSLLSKDKSLSKLQRNLTTFSCKNRARLADRAIQALRQIPAALRQERQDHQHRLKDKKPPAERAQFVLGRRLNPSHIGFNQLMR